MRLLGSGRSWPSAIVVTASLLLHQVKTQNTGDLGVHYDHPLGRSDAASINFVPFDHDASQLVRVRRESPVADADYDAPHGSPASGSAIPQPSGSGNVVDNTLSTTIATTTKAPQISKSGVQNETSSSNGGTRINTKVESEAEDDYDDTRHFVNSDLNNKAEVDSQDFEKDLMSKVKNKEITDATNINNSTDSHKYYVGHFVADGKSWVDLDKFNKSLVKEHKMLSKSYRRAATVPLSFDFPFYGHNVSNITIATGGFLYTGDYVHAWLAATQYIAPLMANFDTSQNDQAKIRYADNGTALIVEWEKVHLKARDASGAVSDSANGASPFSFQVVLHSTGDIVFAYKDIPLEIKRIGDKEHPVKVGLSDAYIIDRTIFFVRRKTIYEYHRMDMKDNKIRSASAIYFKALATCISKSDCDSCIHTEVETVDGHESDYNQNNVFSTKRGKNLGCMWCPIIKRCSDGMDRIRQTWLRSHCEEAHNKKGEKECHVKIANPNTGHGSWDKNRLSGHDYEGRGSTVRDDGDLAGHEGDLHRTYSTLDKTSQHRAQGKLKSSSGHYQAGVVTTVALTLLLVLSCFVWFGYAYFFPHTWSGQLLIKYRPSHWQWRRAEPRYTAASIHM